MTIPCLLVGGVTLIPNLQCSFVKSIFTECTSVLALANWVPSYATAVNASSQDSANMRIECLPILLSRQSLFMFRDHLVVNIEDPCYPGSAQPDIGSKDIIVPISAVVRLLVNYQANRSPD